MIVDNLDSGAKEIWVQIPGPPPAAMWPLKLLNLSDQFLPYEVELVTESEAMK